MKKLEEALKIKTIKIFEHDGIINDRIYLSDLVEEDMLEDALDNIKWDLEDIIAKWCKDDR